MIFWIIAVILFVVLAKDAAKMYIEDLMNR